MTPYRVLFGRHPHKRELVWKFEKLMIGKRRDGFARYYKTIMMSDSIPGLVRLGKRRGIEEWKIKEGLDVGSPS